MVASVVLFVCAVGSTCWAAAWAWWVLKALIYQISCLVTTGAVTVLGASLHIHIGFRRLHDLLVADHGGALDPAAAAGYPPLPPPAAFAVPDPLPLVVLPIELEPCRHQVFTRVGTNGHFIRFSCYECHETLLRYRAGEALGMPVPGVHYRM